jgi:DNA polymerase elongation subunit (family B)
VPFPLPQAEFCVAKGYKADCEVIYGDTDSVMVNFKVWGSCVSAEGVHA